MKFFNFLNFFAIFLGISLPRLGRNGIRDEIFFFFSFSAYLNPVWIEIMPEWIFFFEFFWEFSCSGRVGTEFETKIFFYSHFMPISVGLDRNIAGMMFFNFLNFFAIFLQYSSPGRVWMDFQDKIFFFFPLSHPISTQFG